ncbi:SAC3/GANP-like germinal-center associated nuclear protein [Hamiltosporidium magnivora]|uniref:SAC3/GANP-like germinal-center associated nuclear protein n=1 Tax=Hamiltosporidium magnivora TaxID=148818 RepID=A0A4Q9L537_9MICR|nr:SAC3/GANP-like germinal-center associated nuclear protein [Hamiltosporidium magnivora]
MPSNSPNNSFLGTCLTFCPPSEITDRTLRKDISPFEQKCLIKRYQRSSAGKSQSKPEDVRPLEVLIEVMKYLFSFLDQTDFTKKSESSSYFIHDIYKFIEDRSRAVRLDIAIQNLNCNKTINELEKICRFYILFYNILYSHPHFEHHLNIEQLKKTILTLLEIYNFKNKISPEFLSYYILLHLNDPDTFSKAKIFSCKITPFNILGDSFKVLKVFQQNDYKKFIFFMRRSDFFSSSILLNFKEMVRSKYFKVLKRSVVDGKVDLFYVKDCMGIENVEEIKYFLSKEGIPVRNEEGDISLDEIKFEEKYKFFIDLRNKNYEEREIKMVRVLDDWVVNRICRDKVKILKYGNLDFYILKKFLIFFSKEIFEEKSKNFKIEQIKTEINNLDRKYCEDKDLENKYRENTEICVKKNDSKYFLEFIFDKELEENAKIIFKRKFVKKNIESIVLFSVMKELTCDFISFQKRKSIEKFFYDIFIKKWISSNFTTEKIKNLFDKKIVNNQNKSKKIKIKKTEKKGKSLTLNESKQVIVSNSDKYNFKNIQFKRLLVVLDKSIYSTVFKTKILNCKISELNPEFVVMKKNINYEELSIEDISLLDYKCVLFSVDKRFHNKINEHFFMINKIVDLPCNMLIKINNYEEMYEWIILCKGIYKMKLSDITDIGCLLKNRRNKENEVVKTSKFGGEMFVYLEEDQI